MKRGIAVLLLAGLLLGLCTGCGREAKRQEIIVFAAASLTESLTLLAQQYEQQHPEQRIVFNFDSSGTLLTQITEGAPCHLFLSAGQSQMEELTDFCGRSASVKLAEGSPVELLENKVVLAVSPGAASEIGSFAELRTALEQGEILLCVGNGDVPVGQYSRKILDCYGLSLEMLEQQGCISYAGNVKEITTQISEGLVDCGLVYATDAHSAALQVADTATEEQCGRVIYPGAVLEGQNVQQAQAFLDYLGSEEARKIFEAVGFTVAAR